MIWYRFKVPAFNSSVFGTTISDSFHTYIRSYEDKICYETTPTHLFKINHPIRSSNTRYAINNFLCTGEIVKICPFNALIGEVVSKTTCFDKNKKVRQRRQTSFSEFYNELHQIEPN